MVVEKKNVTVCALTRAAVAAGKKKVITFYKITHTKNLIGILQFINSVIFIFKFV